MLLVVWVLLYVHRNRRFIREGSPGRPPRLSHSSWALKTASTFEEREKLKRNRTEALLLTSLAPCRYAKLAPRSCLPLYSNILCCSLGPLPTRTEWYWQARKHAEAGSPLDRPEIQRPHPWMCQQHIDRPGMKPPQKEKKKRRKEKKKTEKKRHKDWPSSR